MPLHSWTRIATSVAHPTDHPHGGRPERLAGTRELVVPDTPLHRRVHGGGGLGEGAPRATRRTALVATRIEAGSAQARAPRPLRLVAQRGLRARLFRVSSACR